MRPGRIAEEARELVSGTRERGEHLDVLRRAVQIRGLQRPPRAVAPRVRHERLMVRGVGADADDPVGSWLMCRDVVRRQALQLLGTFEGDVTRVAANVARVVLAESGQLGAQLPCAIAIGRRKQGARSAHVRAHELDEAAVHRAERRRIERSERVVERTALQLALPQIDGLALQLLGELLHTLVWMHRDIDPAFAGEIAQLDLEVIERRDHRILGVRRAGALDLAQQRLRAG